MKAVSFSRINTQAPLQFHVRHIALAILTASAAPAYAIDYSVWSTIDAQANYNDNLRMSEEADAVSKYLVTPVISFNANSETTRLGLTSIFYFNRYDEKKYDSDDQNIGLSFSHEFETSRFGLNANLVRESTVTSEVLSSGIVGESAQRTKRYVVSPSWSYSLSDSNAIQFAGTYTTQEYPAGYTGYDNTSGSVDWIHTATERLQLVLSAQYNHYESDDVESNVPLVDGLSILVEDPSGVVFRRTFPAGAFGTETSSSRTTQKGGQLGVDYVLSEQSKLRSRLGYSQSENSYPQSSDDDICSDPQLIYMWQIKQYRPYLGNCFRETTKENVSTAELGWNWKNENHTFDLSGTKQMQPTANGYTVDSLLVNTNWAWSVTELDQVSARLTLLRNRATGDTSEVRNGERADRDYGSATLTYRRQFGEQWFVTTSYQYNRQKYLELDTDANSKVVSLSVQYRPQARHWSR